LTSRNIKEKRKAVFIDDLSTFLFSSLLHLIPITIAMVIVIINLDGLYVGKDLPGTNGENSLAIFAFQLAAKVLELLMLASLSAIVFQQLRELLNSEDGVPFGAIAACFQITTISNLWSPELVGMLTSGLSRPRFRIVFLGTVVFATILGLVVGPSSATALKPFINNWSAGGTTFWLNTTSDHLYPPVLNDSFAIDYDCQPTSGSFCPSRYWNPLADAVFSFWPRSSQTYPVRPEMIRSAYIPGRQSLRSLTTRLVGPFLYNPGISFATVQTEAVASAVAQLCSLWTAANTDAIISKSSRSFRSYDDIICSTKTMQPVVFVRCDANDLTSSVFLNFNPALGPEQMLNYDINGTSSRELFDGLTGNESRLGLIWTNLYGSKSDQPYLGAVVAIPRSTDDEKPGHLLSCAFDARWVDNVIEVSFSNGPFVISGRIERLLLEGLFNNGSGAETFHAVQLKPTWAQRVNSFLQDKNATVFETLSIAAGLWSGLSDAREPVHAVEGILASMIAQGMGLTGKHATIQGNLAGLENEHEWEKEILPTRREYGEGGNAFVVNELTKQKYPKLTFVVRINGYGYGYSTSSLLSLVTMLTYILIATAHVCYSISRYHVTSSAWNSISEILALALRSAQPEGLRNTGAGIAGIEVFQMAVNIGVDEQEDLQLQMVDGGYLERGRRPGRRLEKNKLYG
jgi:hypothetical protein